MDLGELIALVIIAILAGAGAANLYYGRRRSKKGSITRYFLIGFLGAIVGLFIFRALDITMPEFLNGTITVGEIVIALIGSLIVLVAVDAVD